MVDNEEKYLLGYPTLEDVRFMNDDNPIESDLSDDDGSLIKCNGWTKLNPTGRKVYRLLKEYNNSIWTSKTVIRPKGCEEYLLRAKSPQDLAKIKKTVNNLQGDPNGSRSINRRGKRSSNKMSSQPSGKRKREEGVEDDVDHRDKKIAKISKSNSYNKPDHTLSSDSSVDSSDSEPYCEEPRIAVNVQDSDTETDVNHVNSRTKDSSSSRVNNSDSDEMSYVGTTSQLNSQIQGNGLDLEKDYQEHIFTQKDEEEISKFSSLLDHDIVENNNIWILQCPSSMDCSGLVDQQINLNESSKIGVANCSYESFSFKSKGNRFATLAVPSDTNQLQLMRIPIAGNIIVEEDVDLTSDSSLSVTEPPRCVEMPQNLQTRHPLFGKNYKKQIKMAKKMELMLKNKETDNINCEQDDVYESDFVSPKKKKKRKKNH